MNKFKLFLTQTFEKSLNKIKGKDKDKLLIEKKLINQVYPQLKANPNYGPNIKKLKDWSPDTWRYRIGIYRVFYEIDNNENIIFITVLEKRKNAY